MLYLVVFCWFSARVKALLHLHLLISLLFFDWLARAWIFACPDLCTHISCMIDTRFLVLDAGGHASCERKVLILQCDGQYHFMQLSRCVRLAVAIGGGRDSMLTYRIRLMLPSVLYLSRRRAVWLHCC